MTALDYRPDLDGLRGFGVMIVIAFHVGFAEPSGGFVAVDMFFVISGFLITRLIRHEYRQSETFSYANFYLRRARRLMPALFFTLAASFVVGAWLFAPDDLERFGGAVVHAVASLSNVYFWSEAGYFDAESSLKPLLHTWSLGVEEQFYLFWPVCLILLLSRFPRLAVPTVIGLGAVSLGLNLAFADGNVTLLTLLSPTAASWFEDGPAALYFLTPFRVFEFAIGAWAVWWMDRPPPRPAVKELLAAAGFLMLVVPMFVYDENTVFPSVFGLPPCLGTALMIYTRDARTNRALAWPPLVTLGLASYSIYLAHQPIMAFYRYAQGALTAPEQVALSVASVAVGFGMYRFVERPFRRGAPERRWSPGGFGFGCAMSALLITLVSANSWATRGWPWRYGGGDEVALFTNVDQHRRERDFAINAQLAGSFDRWKKKLLVVGDSTADDLLLALASSLGDSVDVERERYRPRCAGALDGGVPADHECEEIVALLKRSIKLPSADEIYVSFQTSSYFHPHEFEPLIAFLKQRARPDTRIVLLGRSPVFPGFRPVALSMLSAGETHERVEIRAREAVVDATALDARMREAAERLGIEFASRFETLCSADRCRYFTDDGALLYWDPYHMTVVGSAWWGPRIASALTGEAIASAPAAANPTAADPATAAAAPPTPPPAPPAIALTTQDAERILAEYGALLSELGIDGTRVFDLGKLPRSKEQIRSALTLLLRNLGPGRDRDMLEFGVRAVAFFQPGVGDASSIEETGPDGRPWRSTVEVEMAQISQSMTQ